MLLVLARQIPFQHQAHPQQDRARPSVDSRQCPRVQISRCFVLPRHTAAAAAGAEKSGASHYPDAREDMQVSCTTPSLGARILSWAHVPPPPSIFFLEISPHSPRSTGTPDMWGGWGVGLHASMLLHPHSRCTHTDIPPPHPPHMMGQVMQQAFHMGKWMLQLTDCTPLSHYHTTPAEADSSTYCPANTGLPCPLHCSL